MTHWVVGAWDQEHAFPNNANNSGWTEFSDLTGKNDFETSTEIHRNLINNEEYRLKFSDRAHELMRNDGALTPDVAKAAYQYRVDEIMAAMIAESARWGDNRVNSSPSGGPYTQAHFINNTNVTLNNFFPVRTNVVLGQFDNRGWLVSLAAPEFNQYGGVVESGFDLVMTKPGGSPAAATIYYTMDGSDPRLAGGGLSSSAIEYSGPITIVDDTRVKARIFFDDSGTANDWSALVDKTFTPLVIPPEHLPGDYDESGAVEPADFLVWKQSYGQTVEPGTGADGNGDGMVDAADFTVWRDNLGATIAPPPDFSFDFLGQTYTQDFNSFRGTLETLPPHLTITVANGIDI